MIKKILKAIGLALGLIITSVSATVVSHKASELYPIETLTLTIILVVVVAYLIIDRAEEDKGADNEN